MLQRALTHSSITRDEAVNYEKVEFRGDAVIYLAVAQLLMDEKEFSGLRLNESSIIRMEALRNLSLGQLGKALGVEPIMRPGVAVTANVWADIYEAAVGAVDMYLGPSAAIAFAKDTLRASVRWYAAQLHDIWNAEGRRCSASLEALANALAVSRTMMSQSPSQVTWIVRHACEEAEIEILPVISKVPGQLAQYRGRLYAGGAVVAEVYDARSQSLAKQLLFVQIFRGRSEKGRWLTEVITENFTRHRAFHNAVKEDSPQSIAKEGDPALIARKSSTAELKPARTDMRDKPQAVHPPKAKLLLPAAVAKAKPNVEPTIVPKPLAVQPPELPISDPLRTAFGDTRSMPHLLPDLPSSSASRSILFDILSYESSEALRAAKAAAREENFSEVALPLPITPSQTLSASAVAEQRTDRPPPITFLHSTINTFAILVEEGTSDLSSPLADTNGAVICDSATSKTSTNSVTSAVVVSAAAKKAPGKSQNPVVAQTEGVKGTVAVNVEAPVDPAKSQAKVAAIPTIAPAKPIKAKVVPTSDHNKPPKVTIPVKSKTAKTSQSIGVAVSSTVSSSTVPPPNTANPFSLGSNDTSGPAVHVLDCPTFPSHEAHPASTVDSGDWLSQVIAYENVIRTKSEDTVSTGNKAVSNGSPKGFKETARHKAKMAMHAARASARTQKLAGRKARKLLRAAAVLKNAGVKSTSAPSPADILVSDPLTFGWSSPRRIIPATAVSSSSSTVPPPSNTAVPPPTTSELTKLALLTTQCDKLKLSIEWKPKKSGKGTEPFLSDLFIKGVKVGQASGQTKKVALDVFSGRILNGEVEGAKWVTKKLKSLDSPQALSLKEKTGNRVIT